MQHLLKCLPERNMDSAHRAIAMVARKEHKSIEEIRRAIMEAIQEGLGNTNPEVQAMWKQIPCREDTPTPEELIIWAKKKLQSNESL